MEARLTLPADWVFVMRGAPVGKKAERKRKVEDLGGTLVIRDKSTPPAAAAAAAAAATVAAPPSVGTPVQIEGGSSIGSVNSNAGETMAQLRVTMESSLQLPAAWVFLLKSAPVGKKAEGKRSVDDLGDAIMIRDKAAPKPEAASGGVPIALEAGTALGSVSIEATDTLEVARRSIQEKFSGSIPVEFVFVRGNAPVGMKQEKKLTVADCLPVLVLRDKALRRSSVQPPTPVSTQAPPPQPATATDAAMVSLVRTIHVTL